MNMEKRHWAACSYPSYCTISPLGSKLLYISKRYIPDLFAGSSLSFSARRPSSKHQRIKWTRPGYAWEYVSQMPLHGLFRAHHARSVTMVLSIGEYYASVIRTIPRYIFTFPLHYSGSYETAHQTFGGSSRLRILDFLSGLLLTVQRIWNC